MADIIATILRILVVVGAIMLSVPMLVWLERKIVADFQARIGPNRVGPYGLLQSFADGIKLFLKEDIIPNNVDKAIFLLAPVVMMLPALTIFAVIPFGPPIQIHRADLPAAGGGRASSGRRAVRHPGGGAVPARDLVGGCLWDRALRLVLQ